MKSALQISSLAKILLVILLACGGKAYAEKADRDQPIDLEADMVTVNDAKKISS